MGGGGLKKHRSLEFVGHSQTGLPQKTKVENNRRKIQQNIPLSSKQVQTHTHTSTTKKVKEKMPDMVLYTLVIPAFGKLVQEDHHEFQASLGYRVRPCLKNKK